MTTDIAVVDSPVGRLRIEADNGFVVRIMLTGDALRAPQTDLMQNCAAQLADYFAGRRDVFDVPVNPAGTLFQRDVWHALTEIRFGETCSYGQLAAKIGKPGAMRAVGQANHANPILIIIPCHRVVRSDGTAGGYSGGSRAKELLLAMEKSRAGKSIDSK